MKYMKKILMLGMMLLLLTACGENRESEVISKLSNKYGKDFGVSKLYSVKFGQSYYNAIAYPLDDPNLKFDVSIDTKDENFSDEYAETYICKKISNVIENNLNLTGDYYIFTDGVGPQPYAENLVESIEEYYDLNHNNSFNVSLFTTEENDNLYDYDSLFAGLSYLDISADIYLVDQEQLNEIRDYHLKTGKGRTDFDFQQITKSYNVNRVEKNKYN